MNLLRSQYLNSQWKPYPPAPEKCFSLPRLNQIKTPTLLAEQFWLGGRIQKTASSLNFYLEGQGQLLSFDLKNWSRDFEVPEPDILISGDQVCFKLSRDEFLKAQQEQRGLQRILDCKLLSPRKDSDWPYSEKTELWLKWSNFVKGLRESLGELGLVEVESPTLVPCPGTEPSLEPFFLSQSPQQTLFLRTSPELHLKKLLSMGWTDFFELKSCFRDKENSEHHEPEFLMLEWYRAYSEPLTLQEDIIGLIQKLFDRGLIPSQLEVIQKISMRELFKKILHFDLQPETSLEDIQALARSLELLPLEDNWNDQFHQIFVSRIEPELKNLGPIFLEGFPKSQAALARVHNGWAERFEFYWGGFEIANAFHELNTPEEQQLRTKEDLLERKRLGTCAVPEDQDFYRALERGIPPTSGIALGAERLFMAAFGLKNIGDLKPFPYVHSK